MLAPPCACLWPPAAQGQRQHFRLFCRDFRFFRLRRPEAAASDVDYVKEKGTLVVGMTDFAPMDYKAEGSDEWIGFDADMAKAFAESLGVEVEFLEINWDNKALELENKGVDAVWNGMTLTDDVKALMATSEPYCLNGQVVVLAADVADQYQTVESLSGLSFAVENGSAGMEQAEAAGLDYVAMDTQAKALMEVASGTSDAAIIDLLMAGAMIGEGTSYPDLTYTGAAQQRGSTAWASARAPTWQRPSTTSGKRPMTPVL